MARRPKPWFRKSHKAWFVTIGGVQHNLGPTKKAAYDAFYQLMGQPRGRTASPQSLTQIADEFLDWTSRYRSQATYQWYQERLQSFFRRYPDLTVGQLKPYHVQKWATESGRSTNTHRNKMRAVKRCLKWAKAQGYIEHNPIAFLEVPTAWPKEVFVSPEEFAVLLSNTTNIAFSDLLKVTYEVGCRPQESLRLEARHVDLQRSRWVFPASESKGKRCPRIVYLTETAAAITARLVKCHPTGALFRNARNRPWTPDAIGSQFSRLQIRMGKSRMKSQGITVTDQEIDALAKSLRTRASTVDGRRNKTETQLRKEARRKLSAMKAKELAPRYSLYALRHSWATLALKKVDALTVAILMGHNDPSTLARTYQHLSHNPEHLLEQARLAAS